MAALHGSSASLISGTKDGYAGPVVLFLGSSDLAEFVVRTLVRAQFPAAVAQRPIRQGAERSLQPLHDHLMFARGKSLGIMTTEAQRDLPLLLARLEFERTHRTRR